MSVRRVLAAAIVIGVVAALAAGAWWLTPERPAPRTAALDVNAVLGGPASAGFARATQVPALAFPRDHGPHPKFRTEWWYFTGNLQTREGRRFGYELSLFRIALAPATPPRASHFATNQVYTGHFAVTDVARAAFHFSERFARGAAGLAGAQAEPFAVWVEDWAVRAGAHDAATWRLKATAESMQLELELKPAKAIVLQGERGLSRKSAAPGNASYYYSIPRLTTRGTLTVGGERFAVEGLSWLDREWSTSALAAEQAGWDWFGLRLTNGYDLMFYQLRHQDGTADPYSAGVLVDPSGRSVPLRREDVAIEVHDHWDSPRGGRYPARWRVAVPPADLVLELTPLVADQELDVSVRYWEGAVEVRGRHAGRTVSGSGYVELTGYATASQPP